MYRWVHPFLPIELREKFDLETVLHGQLINVPSAARDAEVSRTTPNGYFDILEDTLLAFRRPAFDAKLSVRERKHP